MKHDVSEYSGQPHFISKVILGFYQDTFIGGMTLLQRMVGERDSSGVSHQSSQWSDEIKALWHFSLSFFFVYLFFLIGLQQQGIFRVPGSQVEVNDIKNSFERGRCRVTVSSLWPGEAKVGVSTCRRAVVCSDSTWVA